MRIRTTGTNQELLGLLPEPVMQVLTELGRAGFDAFVVGGASRDLLRGMGPEEIHDWDVATNAPLETVKRLFPASHEVGVSFGVVLARIGGMDIEIARFRTEGEYSDRRHPDVVRFVETVESDLRRRDFTMNGIALGLTRMVYSGGALGDLKAGIIRTIGCADDRFTEDALRTLRAVRFHAQLGFGVECTTRCAILRNAHLIREVAPERVQLELNKILMSDRPASGIRLMHELALLRHVIPELEACAGVLQNRYHLHDVLEHTQSTVAHSPRSLTMRLTALLHDIGKPASMTIDEAGTRHFYGDKKTPPHQVISARLAKDVLARLRYDTRTAEKVAYLVRYHMLPICRETTDRAFRRMVSKHGEGTVRELVNLKRADLLGAGVLRPDEVQAMTGFFLERLEEVMSRKPATKFSELAVDGNDIMRVLGIGPGKRVGKIKQKLLRAVLDDPGKNSRKALLEMVMDQAKPGDRDSGLFPGTGAHS